MANEQKYIRHMLCVFRSYNKIRLTSQEWNLR